MHIHTTAKAMTANIKEKDRFRSNINEPLGFRSEGRTPSIEYPLVIMYKKHQIVAN